MMGATPSKKRKSDDDDDYDEEETETDLNPVQNDRPTKRSKLTSPTATTQEEHPLTSLENVLMDAVVSDLKARKIHRYAWNGSADGAMEQLRNVCSQVDEEMSNFQNRLGAVIDRCPKVEISLKLLQKRRFYDGVTATTMNNEIFVLCHQPEDETCIRVYDLTDLMTKKTTFQLPGVTIPWDLVACSASNCLYLLHQGSTSIEIWRIYEVEQQFHTAPFVTCPNQVVSKITVTRDGRLILYQGPVPSKVLVYKADGSIERELEFDSTISYLHNIMTKSNDNFVLVKNNVISEHDKEGKAVKEYKNPSGEFLYGTIDEHNRIVTVDEAGSVCLLDTELNSLEFPHQLDSYQPTKKSLYRLSFNQKWNVIVAFETAAFSGDEDAKQCLSVFKFTEREVPENIRKKKKKQNRK